MWRGTTRRFCPRHAHPNHISVAPADALVQVVFDFVEKRYPEIVSFNVEGAKVLPPAVVKEVRGTTVNVCVVAQCMAGLLQVVGAKVLHPAVVKEVSSRMVVQTRLK